MAKTKDPAAVALGRKGGKAGGKARAAKMTSEQRKLSAQIAIDTRWSKTARQDSNPIALARAKLNRAIYTKTKIAALRDVLRAQVQDFQDILESLDTGLEDFEVGSRQLERALDKMSELL